MYWIELAYWGDRIVFLFVDIFLNTATYLFQKKRVKNLYWMKKCKDISTTKMDMNTYSIVKRPPYFKYLIKYRKNGGQGRWCRGLGHKTGAGDWVNLRNLTQNYYGAKILLFYDLIIWYIPNPSEDMINGKDVLILS